jgi:hypothetical protein
MPHGGLPALGGGLGLGVPGGPVSEGRFQLRDKAVGFSAGHLFAILGPGWRCCSAMDGSSSAWGVFVGVPAAGRADGHFERSNHADDPELGAQFTPPAGADHRPPGVGDGGEDLVEWLPGPVADGEADEQDRPAVRLMLLERLGGSGRLGVARRSTHTWGKSTLGRSVEARRPTFALDSQRLTPCRRWRTSRSIGRFSMAATFGAVA